ncbi:MAG: hypothetical protein ABSB35_21665 [Bryobacteraceae bacterium]|jgi:hypothetical protein
MNQQGSFRDHVGFQSERGRTSAGDDPAVGIISARDQPGAPAATLNVFWPFGNHMFSER